MDVGKEKILDDWFLVRNAIIRAESGEMKVTFKREPNSPPENANKIIGIFVEVDLLFSEPLAQNFTEAEQKEIAEAIKKKLQKKEK